MHQALGKSVVCKQSHCDLLNVYLLEEISTLLMSFKYVLHSGQVIIRHPRGENSMSWLFQFPLIIPRVPVNVAKIKCGRGLEKDFTILQDSHTNSYERKYFLTNSPNDRFRWEKVYDLS